LGWIEVKNALALPVLSGAAWDSNELAPTPCDVIRAELVSVAHKGPDLFVGAIRDVEPAMQGFPA